MMYVVFCFIIYYNVTLAKVVAYLRISIFKPAHAHGDTVLVRHGKNVGADIDPQ